MEDEWVEMELVKVEAEGRLIHIWAREKSNQKLHHYIVTDFFPYFYSKRPPINEEGVLYVEEEPYTTLFGEKVRKVIVEHPGNVPKLRHPDDYEADIPYVNRFLIDTKIAGSFFIRRSKLNEEKITTRDIRGSWKFEEVV